MGLVTYECTYATLGVQSWWALNGVGDMRVSACNELVSTDLLMPDAHCVTIVGWPW
jgi:hypothetical protein